MSEDNLIVDFISSTRGIRCLVITDYKFNKQRADKDAGNQVGVSAEGLWSQMFYGTR